jgi:pimeloyl-ACP methyl ester carboxylesterase
MYGRAIGETSVLDRKRQRPAFRAAPRQSAGSRYPARRCAAARIASLSRAAADIALLPLHGMMTPRNQARWATMSSDRITVNGIELEVLRRGAGTPVLLLHGIDTVHPQARFLDLLGRDAEIIAPSSPGFGNTKRPADFDTMYDLVHLYLAVLDELPYDKVALLGLSFGGWLAAEIAAASCHRLSTLILVDPVGIKLGGPTDRDILDVFNTNPAEVRRCSWHDPAKAPDYDAMSDEELVIHARNWEALCLYAWHPYMYNPQLKQWLGRIRVPTLMLWGASDRVVTPDYGRAYSRLIPGARFEIIDEAGHHPELEQPERFAERVAAFLRE